MQMVASSKLRRAQEAALGGRPFARLYNRVIQSVVQQVDDFFHPLLTQHFEEGPRCVVLFTSNKGLCGSMNANVLREAARLPDDTLFVTAGRKGRLFLARTGRSLLADFDLPDACTLADTKPLSDFLMDRFVRDRFRRVTLLYPRFANLLVNRPVHLDLLPLSEIVPLPQDEKADCDFNPTKAANMIFEPGPHTVIDRALPYYVAYIVHQAVLSARASEHASRMVAMKHATDNAQGLVKELTLAYNQARQAAITNELLEIVTARQFAGGS